MMLIRYIDFVIKYKLKYVDHRPFHGFWEHKKVMVELIKYLNKHKYESYDEAVVYYTNIEKACLILRNKVLKFNMTKDYKILESFKQSINKVIADEYFMIQVILHDLEHHYKKNVFYENLYTQ